MKPNETDSAEKEYLTQSEEKKAISPGEKAEAYTGPDSKASEGSLSEGSLSEGSLSEGTFSERNLSTSLSHQIFTLLGFSFLCFELLFLFMYFDSFWFSLNLSFTGVLAILIVCLAAHLLLKLLETNLSCKVFAFIFKGKAPVTYQKWIQIENDGFRFGIRHLRWDAISELELSWFGNLIVKSRAICGPLQKDADIVFKLPFSAADIATQQIFLNQIISCKPDLIFNNRLKKSHTAVLARGAQLTQLATAMIMSVILLDVGHGTFYYLELLKNLHLAEVELLEGRIADAQKHYQLAEELRLHPLPISWVSSKFLNSSTVAAGIYMERARILSLMGKKVEALASCDQALTYSPKSLRIRLLRARLLVDAGKQEDSLAELNKLTDEKADALLPKLYVLALTKSEKRNLLNSEYEKQLQSAYKETFGIEPHWPPGGNRFFTELWFSEDLQFLMNRYLESNPDLPKIIKTVKEAENSADTDPPSN